MRGTKTKLFSKQTEWKNFSHVKRQHIFRNQLIPNTENQKEDFDLEKAAANWGGGGAGGKKTVTCSPNEQQKLSYNLYEFFFWLNQVLYKHC